MKNKTNIELKLKKAIKALEYYACIKLFPQDEFTKEYNKRDIGSVAFNCLQDIKNNESITINR